MDWARPIAYLCLVALVFAPLEFAQYGALRSHGRRARPRGLRTDFLFASFGAVLNHALIAVVVAGGFSLLWNGVAPLLPILPWHRAGLGGQALGVALGVLLFEFGGYAYHRSAHASPLLWRFHKVHHSAEDLDWLASFRQHPIEVALLTCAQNLPLVLLGIPLSAHVTIALLLKLNTAFVHSRIRLPRGAWERWIAGPRFHHRHHDRDGLARNYASLFPWIDCLFGTYSAEKSSAQGLAASDENIDGSSGFLTLLWAPFKTKKAGAS